MPALQLDGVAVAYVDPEDAAILVELLARTGPGRLAMPPMLSGGKAEPLMTIEVDGDQRVVTRADWIARLALHFAEDRVDGDLVEHLQAANDQAGQAQGRAA